MMVIIIMAFHTCNLGGSHTGSIVGGVVATVLLATAVSLLALVCFILRMRKVKQQRER